ncbi:MAG: M3 family oligoendopeptidase [Verrucomicrobia bacterium]|nr:M3 family oligoendopeptidase [Verrucomicrobiota bacterium]NBU09235.1 M3 family oligoendopeptidase [Pseudomonadota bacterium]NDD37703.1 M3 family oligoendopeptidase [Verrucomicrobiota bacterium]NDE97665.1 M3 family oligoendopeptidase [Verrucomicrobiota bacterium]
MNLLPFANLPTHAPRRFVPAQIDLGDWSRIAPLFDQLDARASQCQTLAEFERWILDQGELFAALDQEGSQRYIAMTCHTDSPEAEQAYLHFVEKVEPELKPRQFNLAKLFLAHPLRRQLDKHRYEVFDRDTALLVELFREENVPLQTEEAKLGQQYQKLTGSLTVNFRGEEKTLVQMGRYLEEPDRALREEAWRLVAQRRLQVADQIEENFEALLKLREQIARNAGFPNYLAYAFRAKGRFDYTAEDCRKFHAAVDTEFMPVVRQLQAERKRLLGVDALRPWDTAVDPLNRAPLRPFTDVDEMVTRTQRVFDHVDAELAGGFAQMRDLKLLDLANRKGKAPGGYQSTLAEARLPFIFMNSVGVQRDVETMLHEAGHAFHTLAAKSEDLYAYRSAPIEFCEVASMAMELLGNQHLEEFYAPAEANRARKTHLEGIIGFFPWMATVDAFQHWIYSRPGHTRAERTAAWLALMDRFGGDVNWSGHESARANLWHRQLHIFLHPFYYVEYGIAQLGALQVWVNSHRDPAKALRDYKAGLALGGSRPLPELFAAAGCRFDFSAETVRPLVALTRSELAKLQ